MVGSSMPEEGSREAGAYQNDDFAVRMVEQNGKLFVYTRRIVMGVGVIGP
jgi:hypothetical protein